MGLDKRREVVGGSYSATLTRQIVTYAIVVVVVVARRFGLKVLADDLDQPPAKVAGPGALDRQRPEAGARCSRRRSGRISSRGRGHHPLEPSVGGRLGRDDDLERDPPALRSPCASASNAAAAARRLEPVVTS